MAKYAVISTIGILPLELQVQLEIDDLTQRMIQYLSLQINQVLPEKPDIIVLPEMCDRPAGILYEKIMDYFKSSRSHFLEFFFQNAEKNKCYIVYPTIIFDNNTDKIFNGCYLIDRNGQIAGVYKKNYLTVLEIEERGLSCGIDAPFFDCDFGRVVFAICFDLNFEQLLNRYIPVKPDLIIFPSMFHGGFVQELWCYKCKCHFVSALGVPGVFSEIRNPHGIVISSSTNYINHTTKKVNFDCCLVHLDYNCDKLVSLKNKYAKDVLLEDPGKIGSVLLTSQNPDKSIQEYLREFEIEELDSYLQKSFLIKADSTHKCN